MKKSKTLKEVTQASQVPREIITNEPRITLIGEDEVVVENHKGLILYEEGLVKINTVRHPLYIKGSGLLIKKMDEEVMVISGRIRSIEYISLNEEKEK
ncbi:YabP/YqfC family sporulation protein [Caldicellulosiruptor sp. DIB 104C]|uniref:YabP/YqfC family sporulation protein n=1 Tax=Caldicellulosiruptor sp. DIB 104C TaxID=3019889 RepID=UPI00230662EB|nr:YabP/YqfC family sporulation protein [Caldicellulosiruptor sp. DIB 104C]